MNRIKLNIIMSPSPSATPFLGSCCSIPERRKTRRNLNFLQRPKETEGGRKDEEIGKHPLGISYKLSLLTACPAAGTALTWGGDR
jgi:hypothetical protein